MRPLDTRRIAFLALIGAALAVLAAPAGGAPVILYECDLTATLVQATTVSRDTYDVDPKIPEGIKADLIATYKHKYMKFACISSEKFLMTWDREDPNNGKGKGSNRQITVHLPDGKDLIITWIGYKTTGQLLSFQYQCGAAFSMPNLVSGTNQIMKIGEDPNPVILVLSPRLITTTK